ncbi:MAG: ribonuclease E/G, partial [Propionibacteriaceae bacterium]
LRLRDIGGIIVMDFIDMVLPANRDLLLRRLVECLSRDRTRHQVAEVTSLGLVQMTRKRIGTGLLESFSTECEHCHGRGVELHDVPVEHQHIDDGDGRRGNGGGRSRRGAGKNNPSGNASGNARPGNGSASDEKSPASDMKSPASDETSSAADQSSQQPRSADVEAQGPRADHPAESDRVNAG